MSRKRIVTGRDSFGRPIATWETTSDAPVGYGFMEVVLEPVITRRKATAAELAAARAREDPEITRASPGYLKDSAATQASRLRGAAIRAAHVTAGHAVTPTAGATESAVPKRLGSLPANAPRANAPKSAPKPRGPRGPRNWRDPRKIAARDARAVEVMRAMRETGGDMARVALILGMKRNAVAMVVKHAKLRGEAVA